MKILYFTDPHIRANSPGSRLDDFPEAILSKLEWVGDYAEDNHIKTILVGGDWLDRPDIAYSMLDKFTEVLIRWKGKGIDVYTVLGNHDLYGYNPQTFSRTALSLLVRFGLLKRLSKAPLEIDNVSITGVDAHFLLDKNDNVDDYVIVDGAKDKLKIHVVHGFLDNEKWENVPSTAIKDIAHTSADIILTGHEHTGYGVVKKSGKIFCNPGALARVTAGIGDVNQEVKVAIIDSEKKDIELIKLPLDIAKPSSEVLDRDKLVREKEHKSKLAAFQSVINDFQTPDDMNTYMALEALAKEENLAENVVELARKKLEEAEEDMKKGKDE